MVKFKAALRRAVATFIFSTGGVTAGASLFGYGVAQWKLMAGVGLGAVANLAYRWATGVVEEPHQVVGEPQL